MIALKSRFEFHILSIFKMQGPITNIIYDYFQENIPENNHFLCSEHHSYCSKELELGNMLVFRTISLPVLHCRVRARDIWNGLEQYNPGESAYDRNKVTL